MLPPTVIAKLMIKMLLGPHRACPLPAGGDGRVQECGPKQIGEEDELWLTGITFKANTT